MKQNKEFTIEDIQMVLRPVTADDLKVLSRKELVELLLLEQKMRVKAFKDLEKSYEVEGKLIFLKRRVYGISSEKSPCSDKPKKTKKKKSPSKRSLKPSERYLNVEIVDYEVEVQGESLCPACDSKMEDSGLRETSEQLTIVPKKYLIERHHHVTYKCPCCDTLDTTPRVPRIKPGGSYSVSRRGTTGRFQKGLSLNLNHPLTGGLSMDLTVLKKKISLKISQISSIQDIEAR